MLGQCPRQKRRSHILTSSCRDFQLEPSGGGTRTRRKVRVPCTPNSPGQTKADETIAWGWGGRAGAPRWFCHPSPVTRTRRHMHACLSLWQGAWKGIHLLSIFSCGLTPHPPQSNYCISVSVAGTGPDLLNNQRSVLAALLFAKKSSLCHTTMTASPCFMQMLVLRPLNSWRKPSPTVPNSPHIYHTLGGSILKKYCPWRLCPHLLLCKARAPQNQKAWDMGNCRESHRRL